MEWLMQKFRNINPDRASKDDSENVRLNHQTDPRLFSRARLAQIKTIQVARHANETLDIWEGRDPIERELTGK